MTATLTTTAYSLTSHTEAIQDAIAEAEVILGPQHIVTRIECVAEIEATYCDPTRVTSYKATVEAIKTPTTREDHS